MRYLKPILVLALAVLAGCGSSDTGNRANSEDDGAGPIQWIFPAEEVEGAEQQVVGSGAGGAVILTPEGDAAPRRVAIYLHRWAPRPPSSEEREVVSLLRAGNTVVFPAYQEIDTAVEDYLPNALAGIRDALSELEFEPESLVAVGRTTGGALAFDIAASARASGLPPLAAAVAISPGREPAGRMPRPDYGGVPSSTWLMAVEDPGSRIPGAERESRMMMRLPAEVPSGRKQLRRWPEAVPKAGTVIDRVTRARWRPILDFIDLARDNQES